MKGEPTGFPRVPVVTSKSDVEKVLRRCADRPIIELLMNRQNNKYSYTHQSDENFLRNQELFDKLVLRFNNRVLFIKSECGEHCQSPLAISEIEFRCRDWQLGDVSREYLRL